MELLWLISMLVLPLLRTCDSARILVFQHNNARSHSIVTDGLFEELAARGHQLTVVTSFPQKPPLPNRRDIDISYKFPKIVSNFSVQMIRKTMPHFFQAPFFMTDLEHGMCGKILPEPKIQNLYRSDETFDLVMTEIFASDCYVPFAHKFNAPLVSFTTSSALPWVADRVGLPDNPSYIPNYYLDSSTDMTLYERLCNTVIYIWSKLVFYYYSLPLTDSLVRKYLEDSLPPLEELIKNTSLILVNSHVSLSLSRPFPPNVVEIGGIHIQDSSEQLPKDLQEILDQSQQGAFLVSFGSLVRASSIPRHKILMFMKVFAKIPQTVIFKYEDDLPEAPPNVVIRKWIPQRQVIEHKNLKFLLAHGGQASTIESVYFGKPIIGIPFFADQYLNIKALVRRGAAIMLDFDSISEDKIEVAIKEILMNEMYTKNVQQMSLQFRDRPMTPLQTAVYWTEYVIRHRGAPHLRPASVDLPLYQYLLLDVIAVLLLPLIPIFYTIYFLFFRAVEVSPNDYRKLQIKKGKLNGRMMGLLSLAWQFN